MLMLELFYAFFIWLFVIGGFIGGFLRQLEDYSELDFFIFLNLDILSTRLKLSIGFGSIVIQFNGGMCGLVIPL
jgi:hypothetical protein